MNKRSFIYKYNLCITYNKKFGLRIPKNKYLEEWNSNSEEKKISIQKYDLKAI